MVIDLRSDSSSIPTAEMVQAMCIAAAEPPGFLGREDRYVRRLEAELAERIGAEDALFCPTCTMANQISVGLHCKPGQAIIVQDDAHLVVAEGAAPAALFGVSFQLARRNPGGSVPERLVPLIATPDGQPARAALVWLENTHVRSGGTVLDLPAMKAVHDAARHQGLPLHLDGSRLFNAAAALGVEPADLSRLADSVSISMNKGLAAPLGAILAGSRAFIREAEDMRHRLGGAWRSANMAAAAASVALRTMIERLPEDHAMARELALELSGLEGLEVDLAQVQSNIVLVGLDPAIASLPDAISQLEEAGIRVSGTGQRLRLVTYYQIRRNEVLRVVAAFKRLLLKPHHNNCS